MLNNILMPSPHQPSHAEFIDTSAPRFTGLLRAIQSGESVNGIVYANTVLSGPDITDEYDPAVKLGVDTVTAYFPGIDPESSHRYESFLYSDKQIDMTEHRTVILGLNVGKKALARIVPRVSAVRSEFDRQALIMGSNGTSETLRLCVDFGLPVSLVQLGPVIESERMTIGANTALLYYPLTIHPKPALRQLQHRLRGVIADEQLSASNGPGGADG